MQQFAYGTVADGNTWLHFFERLDFPAMPPTRVETCEYATSRACRISAMDAYATYKVDANWRRDYHRLFTRFIRVRPFITERVEALHRARMKGRFCVGVHYRNPLHASELLRPMPPPEAFIAQVRKLLPFWRRSVIVLASDFEPAVTAFRAAFGDRLVLQPAVARASALTDQMHHGVAPPDLALGEQVLVDCLLLARCHVLLHVTSNVATAAGYINPALEMVYCETPEEALDGLRWAEGRRLAWASEDAATPAAHEIVSNREFS
jgi:hypothetical protein